MTFHGKECSLPAAIVYGAHAPLSGNGPSAEGMRPASST